MGSKSEIPTAGGLLAVEWKRRSVALILEKAGLRDMVLLYESRERLRTLIDALEEAEAGAFPEEVHAEIEARKQAFDAKAKQSRVGW